MESPLKIEDFDYTLPPELIAQYPAAQRELSRLLVYDQATGAVEHRHFKDIADYFEPGDCLALNESRVMAARLHGVKTGTGGRVELLLTRELEPGRWESLVSPKRRVKPGTRLTLGLRSSRDAVVERDLDQGGIVVQFAGTQGLPEFLAQEGEVPLPPYIDRKPEPADTERYQTVYASENGSVAAPTAGLHFTREILGALEKKGVRVARLSLHVGWGTFKPVREIASHQIHSEFVKIPQAAVQTIRDTLDNGKRVFTVGTTTARALEWAAMGEGPLSAREGWCDIFITPGYQFKIVKRLITNFHLPQSSLLLLVSALIGREKTMELYGQAVAEKYRFYSYGDCMLIK